MNLTSFRKILIVDDNPIDREIYQRYLGKSSNYVYKFLQAETEAEALTLTLTEQPDCVLLDYLLPDANGIDFLNHLNSQRQTITVPIVMLTGLGNEAIAVQALKSGAQDYLIKGKITPESLATAINRAIDLVKIQRQLSTRYQQHHIHLVIVAQNQADMEFYRDALKQDTQYTYTLLHVNTGQEAVTLYRKKQADCILLHYELPDTNGIELIDNFRDGAGQITLPIIMVTAKGNETIAVQAMKSGVQDYLVKLQLTPTILIAAIHNAIEKIATQRQLIEKTMELQETNRALERALCAKDNFLATMTHELRSPLNTILGVSEALQEGIYGSLSSQQINKLQLLRTSGIHLLNLIGDILDVTRISTDQLKLQIGTVSVTNICETCLQLMKSSLNEKSLQLTFLDEPAIATIQADEQRLQQVVLNLLNNAVKFTANGGAIGLEVNSDELSQTICFTIWDTGIGISPESIRKLFKPFVQVDSRLARYYQGSGLGLFLVYHLVKLHGGSVSITSEAGKGSRFTVALPWISSYQSTLPILPSSLTTTNSSPTATLLLAESNQATLASLVDYLTLKGYEVILAKNGNEALEKVKTISFNLLLITLQLEGVAALDVIRCWRADARLTTTPIVAMTALSIPGDKEESLAAGANEYLVKPLYLKQLAQLIERLV